ncbi:MAG: DUF6527 family protein [bacterium]
MADIMKISWWQWLPIFGWRIVGMVKSADDIPLRLPRNGAVLVGSLTRPKWVAFDCPCRSGHRIMLNTDKNRFPFWTTTVRGPLTITPSIDSVHHNLSCHYFVRNGRIQWV